MRKSTRLLIASIALAALLLIGQAAQAAPPKVSVDDAGADEADGRLRFAIELSRKSTRKVRVAYETADGTDPDPRYNATAGEDYTAKTGTAVVKPGRTRKVVSVPISNDAMDDYDRGMTLNLTSAKGGAIKDDMGNGTIFDDDAEPTVTIEQDVTILEGDSGNTAVYLYLQLSAPSKKQVLFGISNGGTANALTDYEYPGPFGLWVFNPGETILMATLTIYSDTAVETDETVTATLAGSENATIGSPSMATVTIQNDD